MERDLGYDILHALMSCEMTGYELICALRAGKAPVEEGDGYLYPFLLLLEQQGLVRSFTVKEKGGMPHRYYSITALGLYHYRNTREKRNLSQFDLPETSTPPRSPRPATGVTPAELPKRITASVSGRKLKKRFLNAYTTHIADARAAGESDDAILSSFGDVSEIASAAAEFSTAFQKHVRLKPRVWLYLGAGVLLAALFVGIWFMWQEFLLEISAIIGGILAAIWLFRITRAYLKRRRAYRLIEKAAEECGCQAHRRQSILSSVFKTKTHPSMTVKSDDALYKIRFVTAWNRRKILKFRSPYVYQVFTMRGIAMAYTHRSPFSVYFKPRNMSSGGILKLYHTYLVEFDGPVSQLPVYEKRHDDNTTKQIEVVLLNPAPMRAAYVKSSETTLVGGETIDGVMLHDAPGFSEFLRRTKKS